MSIIRKKELKALGPDALSAKLLEVCRELNTERGLVQSGGRSSNPGRIRELRHVVARILTFMGQKQEMARDEKKEMKAASAAKSAKTASAAASKSTKATGAKAPAKKQ